MESFQFIAPARVKVSLVPLDGISPKAFHHYAKLLQSVNDIRLVDLSPLPKCHHFNPQEFSQGRIFYSISEGFPNNETAFLEDFEPFRKTFIVIGIGLNSNSVIASTKLKNLEYLKEKCPGAVIHNTIYFQSSEHSETNEEIFHMSEESESISTAIETIMCGITLNFLTALDDYVSSYESITLRSPVSLQDSSALTRTIYQTQKRLSSGQTFKGSFSNGQTAISSTKDQKVKSSQRQTGRRNKIMGNFYLLAGRTNLALQYFTDAAINAKKADDDLWLASALESMSTTVVILSFLGQSYQIHNPLFATVLHLPKAKSLSIMKSSSKFSAESVVSRPSISEATPRTSTSSSVNTSANHMSPSIDVSYMPIVDLLLLLVQRCSHYYRASTADAVDCVADIVFIESLMRTVKLMITVYASNGNGTASLIRALAGFEAVTKQGDGGEFSLSQHTITAEINQIFLLQLNKLDFVMQCKIYCAIASVYRDLGLRRKCGLVLRLLLEVLMPYASKSTQGLLVSGFESMNSIRNIIDLLLKTYGLDTNTETSEISAAKHYSDWIVLQLSLIKVCLRIAEINKDYDTLSKLCILALSRFTHCLPADDQVKLRDKLLWSHAITKQDGLYPFPHPDPFLIRDAKYVAQPQASGPVLQTVNNAESRTSLFDPSISRRDTANLDIFMCQGEPQYLEVTMQNPFHFDLNVTSIRILADEELGVETIASMLQLIEIRPLNSSITASNQGWKNINRARKPQSETKSQADKETFVIPPISAVVVKVGFKVLKPGKLSINSFEICLVNQKPQIFCIAGREIFHGSEKMVYVLPYKKTDQFNILDNNVSSLLSANKGSRIDPQSIDLSVIPLQPELVTIWDPSISNWTMLLEGEIQNSTLRVQNCSKIQVDHLAFSLWDTSLDSINAKLNQSNLNAAEVYELEWQLLKKRSLVVTNKSQIASEYKIIQPQEEIKIEYQIFGKRGLTTLNLILEYAKKSGDKESFFHRNLIVPFNVSVHRSLELIANDIIPISSPPWDNLHTVISNKVDTSFPKCLKEALDFISSNSSKDRTVLDFCLLVLDIKNFWRECLTAKFCSTVSEGIEFTTEVDILPGNTSRVFLPLQRIKSGELNFSEAIPSLRNKQFIKNYSLSEEEENRLKQAFWLKNKVLKNVTGSWSTKLRSGEIDLRRLNIDPEMTAPLLQEDISIHHFITSEEEDEEDTNVELGASKQTVTLQREKFYILNTRVSNHSQSFVPGILRHIPIPRNISSKHNLSIEQKILYNGVLQIHIGGKSIGPGQTYEHEIGFMVLEKGEYEWGCTFDILSGRQETIISQKPIHIVVT